MKKIFFSLIVLGILIGCFSTYYLLKNKKSLESQTLDQFFIEKKMQVDFKSQMVKMQGSERLQFFTLKQVEVFEKKSSMKIKWIDLNLPDVVVGAVVPVTYTYYLELNDKWELNYQNGELVVNAPMIHFNTPSVDVSNMELMVTKGSIFRNERDVLEELRKNIMDYLNIRAQENISLIEENGKREVEKFVLKWIATYYQIKGDCKVKVEFKKKDRSV